MLDHLLSLVFSNHLISFICQAHQLCFSKEMGERRRLKEIQHFQDDLLVPSPPSLILYIYHMYELEWSHYLSNLKSIMREREINFNYFMIWRIEMKNKHILWHEIFNLLKMLVGLYVVEGGGGGKESNPPISWKWNQIWYSRRSSNNDLIRSHYYVFQS